MTAPAPQGACALLRVMLRVADLDAALRFYEDALGMTLRRRQDYPDARFTRAFVACGAGQAALELTWNWDRGAYAHGDAYGYLVLAVPDPDAVCARVASAGGRIMRPAGPMKHGRNRIAFVQDPDGYRIELVALSDDYD